MTSTTPEDIRETVRARYAAAATHSAAGSHEQARAVETAAQTAVDVEVFDPAMCCSTGVCGPSVDPALARFESDLRWLGDQGATVTASSADAPAAGLVLLAPATDSCCTPSDDSTQSGCC